MVNLIRQAESVITQPIWMKIAYQEFCRIRENKNNEIKLDCLLAN